MLQIRVHSWSKMKRALRIVLCAVRGVTWCVVLSAECRENACYGGWNRNLLSISVPLAHSLPYWPFW